MIARRVSITETVLSPWVALRERTFQISGHPELQSFHSLRPRDYVNVLAITRDGRVPLVEQFRPVLERTTLELPGGLIDPGETALQSALRELQEETGFGNADKVVQLPPTCLDTGRLENTAWGFVVTGVSQVHASFKPEEGISIRLLTLPDFRSAIVHGKIEHAGHIAIAGAAAIAGLISFNA